jgi:hypothetical protein
LLLIMTVATVCGKRFRGFASNECSIIEHPVRSFHLA